MMHRRVRRLHLACAREEHARHGRVLLEDALRTATLNDESRLIVVRRLNLGRMPLRASATQWSRRVEESFRRAGAAPVRFDSPAACDSEVVFFASRTEPWFALAERAAQRRPMSEWFWPLAVPNWSPHQSPAETLRHCARALAWQGGLLLTLQLAARLQATNALDPLLRALHADDLAPLQVELGPPAQAPAPASALPPFPVVVAPLTPCELACIRAWGSSDLRTHWLASLHIMTATRGTAFIPAARVDCDERTQLVERWTRPDPPVPLAPPASSATPRAATQPPLRLSPASPPEPSHRPAAAPDRNFTRAGGLFFVLPLLVRAGLPRFLARLPEVDAATLPWQILQLALAHARIPEDDPLVVALRELPRSRHPLGHWLIAANRHARRLCGANLRQIIARPALATVSATHIDLFFRPGDAELRLRRAALDIDPGWVPWLGRVIAFHFNRED